MHQERLQENMKLDIEEVGFNCFSREKTTRKYQNNAIKIIIQVSGANWLYNPLSFPLNILKLSQTVSMRIDLTSGEKQRQ